MKETQQGKVGCVVPPHDELETGTVLAILRQAKISRDEFLEKLNE